MKKITTRAIVIATLLSFSVMAQAELLPEVPEGVQALTVDGRSLFAAPPSEGALEKLAQARTDYESDTDSADNIIWYARRTAYTGDYRGAIEIFSEGIKKHPDDARMYRHRGHRYISIREFDRAVAALEKATQLIAGTENETEPDGLPNARGIPISSLHGNTWYHLGLAYFLKHDWENAYRAYENGFNAARNVDNKVSTTHWRYTILRRMGRNEDAERVLDAITADMDVIENTSYHRLCLFYKGELSLEEIMADVTDSPSGASAAYGVASWHYSNGDMEKAREQFEALTADTGSQGQAVTCLEQEADRRTLASERVAGDDGDVVSTMISNDAEGALLPVPFDAVAVTEC